MNQIRQELPQQPEQELQLMRVRARREPTYSELSEIFGQINRRSPAQQEHVFGIRLRPEDANHDNVALRISARVDPDVSH